MVYPGTRQRCTVFQPQECFHLAVEALDHHLTIPIRSSLDQESIFTALTGIAAQRLSLHSLSLTLEKVPSETSFRHHLAKIDHTTLEHINHSILTYMSKEVLKQGKEYKCAIDFTLDPYYGEITPQNEEFIIKSKLHKSTTKFYGYATLYTTTKNQRITLSVLAIRNGVSKVSYIAHFLDVIKELGISIEVLCLDRAFYAKKVFSFLQMAKIPNIDPVYICNNLIPSEKYLGGRFMEKVLSYEKRSKDD